MTKARMAKRKRLAATSRAVGRFRDKVKVHTSSSGTQFVLGSSLLPREEELRRVAAQRFNEIKSGRVRVPAKG